VIVVVDEDGAAAAWWTCFNIWAETDKPHRGSPFKCHATDSQLDSTSYHTPHTPIPIPIHPHTSTMSSLSSTDITNSLTTLTHNYKTTTPSRVKLIDSFLLVLVISGVLQFAYRILITSYPFNAFLGG
jgi:hypothetical protein